ncbi:gamma-aminobutyric acid receptor subunit rho-1-like [Nematostella vectensis]|uniref:gamma-aminobutyric acid receptor subunit rho-1-like n=1 Tax=Nematostella vectensis TaxID=45351 RepID=UPI00207795EF|nr:gamma-aminobutyric acid receptor subunit rho-1-like [Nematostella vectensis]
MVYYIFADAYPVRHLLYRWKNSPGIKVLDGEMSQFYMTRITTSLRNEIYVAASSWLLSDSDLHPLHGHRVRGVDVTLGGPQGYASTLSLCIATLLTIATIWGNVNSSMPRVSYVKSMDIYLMTSFTFVLGTLLEYIVIMNKGHPKSKKLRKPVHQNDSIPPYRFSFRCWPLRHDSHASNTNHKNSSTPTKPTADKDSQPLKVEVYARIGFLSAFVLFNGVYWAVLRI